MADVIRAPLVRCDNCGVTAEKVHPPFGDQKSWTRPTDWGDVRVAPTRRDSYPNQIAMGDLCPKCHRLVFQAVGEALEAGRIANEG
jgi:hypothetical protein